MPSSNPLCFSTQPGCGVVGMSLICALLISSCIIIAFLKKLNMLLQNLIIAKCISGMNLLITMIYRNKCLSLQVIYCCKGTMSVVLKSCLGSWSASSVLAKKIEPAF